MRTYKIVTMVVASLMLLLVASWLNLAMLYSMAAALAGVMVFSYVIPRVASRDLAVTRRMPDTVWEGEVVHVSLSIHSRSRAGRSWLVVHDTVPVDAQPEWTAQPPMISLDGQNPVTINYSFRPRMFGRYELRSIGVEASDPLGLFTVSRDVRTEPNELLVKPRPLVMRSLAPFDRVLAGQSRLDVGTWKGFGAEPHGVREYVPGDTLRHIHWRTSARRNELHVVEFESGHLSEVALAIDFHRDGDFGETPQTTVCEMVRHAAYLSKQAIASGASVRLLGQTIRGEARLPGKTEAHWGLILGALAESHAQSPQPLADLLAHEADMIPFGSTLVVFTALGDLRLPELGRELAARNIFMSLILYDPNQYDDGAWHLKRLHRLCTDEDFIAALNSAGISYSFADPPIRSWPGARSP